MNEKRRAAGVWFSLPAVLTGKMMELRWSVCSAVCSALFLAANLLFGADDPLQRADAYTLELDEAMRPSTDFFPLSILRDDGMKVLPRIGFTFTDGGGHQCREFRLGKKCGYHARVSDRSPVFVSLWAAHTLAGSRQRNSFV